MIYFWYTHFDYPHDILLVGIGLIAALGSEVPDIDQVADRIFHHRDWFTHSPLPAAILFFFAYLYGDYFGIKLVAYVVSAFLITNASHFFLDLFPVWKGSGDKVKGTMKGGVMAPARWFFEGITGAQIYERLEGTYRIHLPFAIPDDEDTTCYADSHLACSLWNRRYCTCSTIIESIYTLSPLLEIQCKPGPICEVIVNQPLVIQYY